MLIRKLLGISLLLLLLAGCSSDDDIAINDNNIQGYWECATRNGESTTGTYSGVENTSGLLFLSDGEIKYWGYFLNDYTGTVEYSEEHWGYFYLDDEGTLQISHGRKDSAPYPDDLYYKVTSLTKDRMIIRSWGGFAGTPFEKGYDVVYKRLSKTPYTQINII